jgi:hypothetical protein
MRSASLGMVNGPFRCSGDCADRGQSAYPRGRCCAHRHVRSCVIARQARSWLDLRHVGVPIEVLTANGFDWLHWKGYYVDANAPGRIFLAAVRFTVHPPKANAIQTRANLCCSRTSRC